MYKLNFLKVRQGSIPAPEENWWTGGELVEGKNKTLWSWQGSKGADVWPTHGNVTNGKPVQNSSLFQNENMLAYQGTGGTGRLIKAGNHSQSSTLTVWRRTVQP